MSLFGLIGHPVVHSLSKELFDSRFERKHEYRLIDLESVVDLRERVQRLGLAGFNVTIPHKVSMMSTVDRLTAEAAEVGAVNCVRVESDGSLTGHNTDAEAFEWAAYNGSLTTSGRRALILGTGGGARAVAAALKRMGLEYTMVSRSPDSKSISYDETYRMADTVEIIVNATPVGMWPEVNATPWMKPELLTENHRVYDLVYNPTPTRFMQEAAEHGALVRDGMAMLRRQAELSWRFWGI